ncbi:MAG TPA: DNA mismatch repair endonuclease MutL, partial [Firmicutes bacterium]|nr:DNA mismatch repair endonuclease MutL [Bacillota bacterium]
MAIALLSEEIINQIAAGEVIERPASVVKELVENSLDAGARRVQITVEGGGTALVRVTDDGEGIPPDEVELAFARHATSKLHGIGDLLALRTLGFRGEALPSIAAVARVTLITRQAAEPLGREVQVVGGTIVRSEECGAPPGTTVEVRDLFFNTPARRKFLKSEAAEAARIAALVTGLALTRPEVSFMLTSEGRTLLQTPGQGALGATLAALLGEGSTRRLLPVSAEREGLRVAGLIGTADLTRANRSWELFAVNGRLIENRTLQVAVEKAYGSLLPLHRYPVVHLRLEVDPAAV